MSNALDSDPKRANAYYQILKNRGLTQAQENKILAELHGDHNHDVLDLHKINQPIHKDHLYSYSDLIFLQQQTRPYVAYQNYLKSLDELLDQDRKREDDGFPRKIRVGRLVRPGKGGKEKLWLYPQQLRKN
ncbi:MAG: hypothetical protein OMM_07464 [Candidatus Magnetoglobus multicellularis str. Araruama]|uniref:Uncharacterized protein n=1 Tax=Candidatus Magnetoglobus multicellularis str. Araruama TaxID=890399 RepID=A0A1V1PCW0_9BACT|nr:MAG: hypothetical protein OMM_07464 [Candidatus Magnetoglobus multicellularis str. Araruama]